ncbi:MAG: LytTR family DNA-binding domain-containing protein [Leeuwenhoekiella sp.]
MNCIVIDDEKTARAIIEHLCRQIPEIELLASFENAVEALKFLNQQEVDLIFLDIHMPVFTGFDFIQTLKHPPQIILTTSDPQFAIEAYEYDVIIDYLVKPITLQRFEKAIDKSKKRFASSQEAEVSNPKKESPKENTSDEELYINIDRRLIKLKFNSILFIEAKGDYIEINTEEKSYRVHTTLKKIKEKLPDAFFIQIHRSYIINFSKIIDIEDNSVLIKKSVIPISRSNRPELMKRLNLL